MIRSEKTLLLLNINLEIHQSLRDFNHFSDEKGDGYINQIMKEALWYISLKCINWRVLLLTRI